MRFYSARKVAACRLSVLNAFPAEQRVRLPMLPDNRSLNLSNTVAVAIFEAWRQCDFFGAAMPIAP